MLSVSKFNAMNCVVSKKTETNILTYLTSKKSIKADIKKIIILMHIGTKETNKYFFKLDVQKIISARKQSTKR